MSEGNIEDLSTGLKAIDLVPEVAAVGTEPTPEASKIKQNAAITYDTRYITHWLKTFNPTGWEVVVDLPYLPDARSSLFLIKCSPYILPIVPVEKDWWVFQKNFFQFIRHDIHSYANISPTHPNTAVGVIPPGIHINQVTDPPPISIYAAHNRFWCGSLNFHVRTVGNFTQSGYIRSTKLKNVAIPCGKYDRYKHAPIPQKLGTAQQAGFFNSYMRGDVTMFRHQEITIPFERVTPVDNLEDQTVMYESLAMIDNLWDETNGKWRVQPEDTTVNMASYHDYIAIESVGGLAASQQDSQLRFIIEIAAGDDFECYTPWPIGNGFFEPQSRYFSQNGSIEPDAVHNSAIKIPDSLPDTELKSDGESTITAI